MAAQRLAGTGIAAIVFSLVMVVMFNFALEADLAAVRTVSTGLLWATILLAGTLGLNRSLAIERENQTIDAILMAPVPRGAIYAGKVVSVTLFTIILEVVLVFVFIVFFNKPFWRPQVIMILVLGTVGYIAVGVLVTSITIQTQTRGVLLPVLLLPLSLPLILPAATAVSEYVLPQPQWEQAQSAVYLVAAYDLLMLSVGFLTYNYVVES